MVLSAAIEAFDDAALDLGSPQDRAAGMVILGTMTGGSEEADAPDSNVEPFLSNGHGTGAGEQPSGSRRVGLDQRSRDFDRAR